MKKIMVFIMAMMIMLAACSEGASSGSQGASLEPGSGSIGSGDPSSESQQTPDSSKESSASASSESSQSQQSASQGSQASTDEAWRLRLVSAACPLDGELDIELDTVQGYRVDARMAPYLRDMIKAAAADGVNLAVISGYRTFAKSAELYENEVQAWVAAGYSREQALVEAASRVAPAGTSEHHTGLAADIFTSEWKGGFVDEFENDKGGIWLRENCARFGFVLRYPKDKTEITGIDYEPWHFRFVGVDNAKKIMSEGLCLEEYLAR